ncbi:hypothetical protein [Providencia stuartii]
MTLAPRLPLKSANTIAPRVGTTVVVLNPTSLFPVNVEGSTLILFLS